MWILYYPGSFAPQLWRSAYKPVAEYVASLAHPRSYSNRSTFSSSRAQSFVLHRHHQSWHTRHSASASPSLAPTRYSSSISSLSVPLMRFPGAKIVFLVLRHQLTTVQAILTEEDGIVSPNMVRWAEGIARESIVLIEGVLQEPGGQTEVKSATVHKLEIKVEKVCRHNGRMLLANVIFKLFIVAHPSSSLPFQVEQVSRTAQSTNAHVGDQTRYNNRVLDLRVRYPGAYLLTLTYSPTVPCQPSHLPYQLGCMRSLQTSARLHRVHRNPLDEAPGIWHRIRRGGLQSRLLPPSRLSRAIPSAR